MADKMHHLSNLLCFGISLLYYYIIRNSSIICFLSSGDIYCSFGISLLGYFEFNSFECESFECSSFKDLFESNSVVILSAILLPIKSPVASAVF